MMLLLPDKNSSSFIKRNVLVHYFFSKPRPFKMKKNFLSLANQGFERF